MKNYEKISIQICLVLLISCSLFNNSSAQKRNFDFDWKFNLGDIPEAYKTDYNDDNWRNIDLPHDWSIEGEYKEENPAGKSGGFLPGGIGWYRKTFVWNDITNKKIFLHFDGVYLNSTVWVNGQKLGFNPNGYIGFKYDITKYLVHGNNTVAVKVDHSLMPTGRWYTGSGIYRHVWIETLTNVHYTRPGGIFITTPVAEKTNAQINVQSEIINSENTSLKVKIDYKIINDKDLPVIETSESKKLEPDTNSFEKQFTLESAKLWLPDEPTVYQLQTIITSKNKILDSINTVFGIRKIEFSAEEGFKLNGQKTKFKGVCNHHDGGAVGSAQPEDVLYKRLKLLKEMGCNAIRTAHNPFAPEFYAMCDTMGFLLMDEALDGQDKKKATYDYGLYFNEYWKKDIDYFIKRDRNHPSVILWSIGNEAWGSSKAARSNLIDLFHELDPTRLVTQGSETSEHLDLPGFNGPGEYKNSLENFHAKNPDRPLIGTEITHTLQTRGVYRTKTWYRRRDNPAPWEVGKDFAKIEHRVYKIPDLTEEEVFPGITKKYQSGYDNSIVRIGVRDDWKRVRNYDYYMGNFRWTGFDYLGESFGWPARTANFGIIDLAGFPKDHYYLYQSLWSNKPMVHILPHWTHPGKEGIEIPMVVYTNCEKAELFLNGELLGEKTMTEDLQLVWKVPYQPGELKVVAKNGNEIMATMIFKTASSPAKVSAKVDKLNIKANKRDVVHIEVSIVDENNIFVPDADNLVNFEITGPGKLIGVENGDILDLASTKANSRKAFKGKCLALVQATDTEGTITLTITAEGLAPATINIKVDEWQWDEQQVLMPFPLTSKPVK